MQDMGVPSSILIARPDNHPIKGAVLIAKMRSNIHVGLEYSLWDLILHYNIQLY